MNFHELLQSSRLILADGSMYELLRRSPEVEFDAYIAHSGLIYDRMSKGHTLLSPLHSDRRNRRSHQIVMAGIEQGLSLILRTMIECVSRCSVVVATVVAFEFSVYYRYFLVPEKSILSVCFLQRKH